MKRSNFQTFNVVLNSTEKAQQFCRDNIVELQNLIASQINIPDKEDHVQTIIVNILGNALNKYDCRRPLIKYLNGIIYQQKLNIINNYKKRKFQEHNVVVGKPLVSSYGKTKVEDALDCILINDFVDSLAEEKVKKVVQMKLDSYSVKEIVAATGFTYQQVGQIYSLFKKCF